MKNWKIGVRLGAGFALILMLMVIMLIISFARMEAMSANLDAIVNYRSERIKQANTLIDLINKRRIANRDMILWTKEDEVKKMLEAFNKANADFVALANDMIEKSQTDEAKQRLHAIMQQNDKVVEINKPVLELSMANTDESNKKATEILLTQVKPVQSAMTEAINDFIEWNGQKMRDEYKQSVEDYHSARNLLLTLGILAVILGSVIGWWITQSVVEPLRQAVKVAQSVADGDLTQKIEADRGDETGQLLKALKSMNDGLLQIVGDIRHSVETINTASQEIAAGNIDLSQRTEEQAASLEETAASMEELTSTVRQNAENAREANSLAEGSSDIAQKGGGVVGEVVTTMAGINESSKKIVDIIGVIDGIAFQTNILALNAAVEAARAGEQGRGFAVVAGEVRSLAQRSAAAAKEIKQLINDSVDKVTTGTALVDRAGATMGEVVDSIRRVTQIMSEITHASTEQSAGIEQVNTAVTQMDEVTQQNAALVEEAAAAASSLQDQARMLMQAVNRFKLDNATQAAPMSSPRAASTTVVARPASKPAPRPVKKARPAGGVVKHTHEAAAGHKQNEEDWEEF